jgi:hypothetical protein
MRKNCAPGAYLINRKTLGTTLEAAMVHPLLLSHGVVLEPQSVLPRCVVCNGSIRDVTDKDEKKHIFAADQVADIVSDDLECYECDGFNVCHGGFFTCWCSRSRNRERTDPIEGRSKLEGQTTQKLMTDGQEQWRAYYASETVRIGQSVAHSNLE